MLSQFTPFVISILISTFLCSLQAFTLLGPDRLLRAPLRLAHDPIPGAGLVPSAFDSYRSPVLAERLGVELVKRPIAALTALLSATAILTCPFSVQASYIDPTTSTVSIGKSADIEAERWNSARFFEEEDSGRLLKVVFSTDGKTACGIDADGKKFVASLQSESSYSYILAPIALLGVGAIAFSKSSEGQAIKAIAGLEGSTATSGNTAQVL